MSTKQNQPFVQDMQPGNYAWCACGESTKQPFCDGSHRIKNTGKTPVHTTIHTERKVAWCGCKESGNKPFCDGTHSRIK